MRDDKLKREARAILGGRCAAPTCRWLNEDGTFGCVDERALVFDHIDGGGSAARRDGGDSTCMICYEIKKDAKYGCNRRFQLLCATCHEIKKKAEKQAQGARQHRQPARVRRSLQRAGEEPRRVKIREADPLAANRN
jgi:hypothetical protein